MKFVALNAAYPNSPKALELQSMDKPVPADEEVLIKVYAAGINHPDILQRRGLYPPPPSASPILGLEVAGVVVACGSNVIDWSVGDQVCALVNGGGYAEYTLALAAHCLPIPVGFSFVQAAALPETFFTVWHNLWQRAQLKTGETLLVHAGASGIGTTAIQLAVAKGIEVYTTAGSEKKCAACAQLGAFAINYQEQDFVAVIKQKTGGVGANVILDMVGGSYIQRNLRVAAYEGRIVNIAYLQGSKIEVDFMPVMLKRLHLTGSTLRAQSVSIKSRIAQELREQVWPLLNSSQVKPIIDSVFWFDQVAQAHEYMESNQHIGKIILNWE